MSIPLHVTSGPGEGLALFASTDMVWPPGQRQRITPVSGLFLPLLQCVSKVTVTGPLHDGLHARELYAGTEALCHGKVRSAALQVQATHAPASLPHVFRLLGPLFSSYLVWADQDGLWAK
jgi:hypothetical protein